MPTAPASSPARVAAPEAPSASLSRRAMRAGIVLAALGGVAYGAHALRAFEERTLTLEGIELPAGDPEPFVRRLAHTWLGTELTLDGGSRVVRATRRELGLELDVDRAVREVRAARGRAPIWERVWALATQHEGRFMWNREVRREETRERAEDVRRRVAVEAHALQRDGTGGRPGMTLNLMGATDAIAEALMDDALVVRLPVRTLEAPERPVRLPVLARYHQVLGAQETRYPLGGELAGRAVNIDLAARQLDGRTIAPGDELSFNEIVGERSFERGFMPAIELARGGRRTEGIGGGVCQVAATLHAAAFFAGFEITEHHPHTRNSSYIQAGLDSAVSWPNRDLRVRNPFEFPVRVRATAYRGLLRVALLGGERAPRVEWSTRVLRRVARGTERAAAPSAASASDEVLDEGEDGSVLERRRTVHWPEGAVTEVRELRYPVVHRLVRGAVP